MLDLDHNIKIADFGLCGPALGRRESDNGYLTTKCGTPAYFAPELHNKQPYKGPSVDLFASAVILFCMVYQRPPFDYAKETDTIYRCIAQKRGDLFWRKQE